MKIIQIPRRFVRHAWGGTETVVLETARRLPTLGHATQIFCPNALADRDHELIDGVRVRRFPYSYPYLGLSAQARHQLDQKGGNLFSFALMRALQSEPDVDLIHLHTIKRLGGIGRYVARQRRIPYIISLHGGVADVPEEETAALIEPTRGSLEWGRLLGAWVGSHQVFTDAAAIVCVGENERAALQARYPDHRVEYLPNGVDVARFAQGGGVGFRGRWEIPADAFVILVMARIDPQKNQRLVVSALPQLRTIVPRAHLLLVGPVTNDAYCQQIRDDIAQKGLESCVTLVPGLDPASRELVAAYHAANLFVLPSVHEPFGISIVEAWAAGLPVLASRVGGVRFLIEDGVDGLLFPSGDKDALIRAVVEVTQMSAEAQVSLVESGRTKACEQYDWDRITARLARLYEDVVR